MFTGIVQHCCPIVRIEREKNFMRYIVRLSDALIEGVKAGASISVSGVCQTVVSIDDNDVAFDAMEETLKCTNLGELRENDLVNIERSARIGDEIGGHMLSGHVVGIAKIAEIQKNDDNVKVFFECSPEWMAMIFPKGFIAIDGASLTIVDAQKEGMFSVYLIPETLKRTTFGMKNVGDAVNIELDAMTQAVVRTVERVMQSR
ncbi:MAG: riboflavin synthase subunit alpha [Gammaproteobacteria bacterium]